MSMTIGEIPYQDKIKDFKQYLDSANRVILSAKFGDGKTFFLQKIRESDDFLKEYLFLNKVDSF